MGLATHRPTSVRTLEDLPDIRHQAALVRATLDLPLGPGSPTGVLRLASLQKTIQDLKALGARVTVIGDLGGERADGVSSILRAAGADAVVTGGEGFVEDRRGLESLTDSHAAFVNDSFQWSYLAMPSLMLPPARLPAVAGRGLEHDLRVASALLVDPPRPFVAILGGANSPLRLQHLQGMILRADCVMVGGAMSLPLLEAVGRRPASGLPQPVLTEYRSVVGLGDRVQHRFRLPSDLLVRTEEGPNRVVPSDQRVAGEVVDIGPATAKEFAELVSGAGTVLWTGAPGDVEDGHRAGTLAVGRALPAGRSYVVVGGDALSAALERGGCLDPSAQLVSATDSLLEMLKSGDLPALPPLRG